VTFTATDKQIAEVCALAVNASTPTGLGFLHYEPDNEFTAGDFLKDIKREKFWCNLDYVQGRMVKLSLWRGEEKNTWKYPEYEPRPDYQSWIGKYPSYPDLLRAAGIEI
jgi:hypothetical protein